MDVERSESYLVTTVLMLSPPVSAESELGLMMNQNKTLTIFTTQIAYRNDEVKSSTDYNGDRLTAYRFNPSRSISFHGLSVLTESDLTDRFTARANCQKRAIS